MTYVNDVLEGSFRVLYRNGAVRRTGEFAEGRIMTGQNCYAISGERMLCDDMFSPAVFTEDMMDYIGRKMEYPQIAKNAGIQGKAVVGFSIDEDGQVQDAKLVEGFHPACDKEALRIIRSMPAWMPASIDGEPISTFHKVPVVFWLED